MTPPALLLALLAAANASEFERIMTGTPPGEPEARIQRLASALKAWTPADSREGRLSALCELGKELVYEQRGDEALPFLDRALEFDKRDACALRWKAEALVERKRYPDARRVVDRLLRVDPENVNGRRLDCSIDLMLERYSQAVSSCEGFARTGGVTQTTQQKLALAYSYAGRTADAERAWRSSTEAPLGANVPQAERVLLDLENRVVEAAVHGWGRSPDAGLAQLDKALEDYPGFTMALLMRGRLYAHLGRFERAVTDFTAVLSRFPGNTPALVFRANALEKAGRKQEAAADRVAACRKGWTPACPPKRGT